MNTGDTIEFEMDGFMWKGVIKDLSIEGKVFTLTAKVMADRPLYDEEDNT